MGYHTELNTLLGLPNGFNVKKLSIGGKFTVTKDRERAFPLHVAILMVTSDWDFLGYAVVNSIKNFEIEFKVISLFSESEQKLYKIKFLEAAKVTGEVK